MLPPRVRVEPGICQRVDDVARRDHVGAAEEDHDVAVGVRRGLVQHLDRSSLNHIVFFGVKKVLLGQSANGSAGVAPVGALMRFSMFSCENTIAPVGRKPHGIVAAPAGRRSATEPGPASARGFHGRVLSRPSRSLVSGVVILVARGVDDVADGCLREHADGLQYPLAHIGRGGIDNQHAFARRSERPRCWDLEPPGRRCRRPGALRADCPRAGPRVARWAAAVRGCATGPAGPAVSLARQPRRQSRRLPRARRKAPVACGVGYHAGPRPGAQEEISRLARWRPGLREALTYADRGASQVIPFAERCHRGAVQPGDREERLAPLDTVHAAFGRSCRLDRDPRGLHDIVGVFAAIGGRDGQQGIRSIHERRGLRDDELLSGGDFAHGPTSSWRRPDWRASRGASWPRWRGSRPSSPCGA